MKLRPFLFSLTFPLLSYAAATPATDALDAGRYAQAYDLAQKSGDLLTASSAALADITFGSATSAKIDQALAAAQAAVKANPNSALAHQNLAGVYGLKANSSGLSLSAYKLAKDVKTELDRALALEPQSPTVLAALARWNSAGYARAGKLSGGSPDMAYKLAQQAFRGAGKDISVYTNVGIVYSDLKDFKNARFFFTKALSLTPRNAQERGYQVQAKEGLTKLK